MTKNPRLAGCPVAHVNELKQEIDQLHRSDIFSVKIYKQTSEIERLAKQLKTLAKS